MIIALAIFNCFSIPFVLAFQPPFANTQAWDLTNWAITAIFAIDVLVNLRTTYIEGSTGEEILDGKKIAQTYLKTFRFWIDVISTVPFEVVFESVVSP